MTKQSFPIPEGCKAVTVEQVGNQIITTFEPVFKRGDVLIAKKTYSKYESILVYGSHDGAFTIPIVGIYNGAVTFGGICSAKYRHATPEEAQLLWGALAKEGKRWNPETMQVEELKKKRWRAEDGMPYYSPLKEFGYKVAVIETHDDYDNYRFNHGFYCQTPDQSERLFKAIKQVTDKFWEEELR